MKVDFMGVNSEEVTACICNQPAGRDGGIPIPYSALSI